jgi:hypothetical protein
MTLCGKRPTRCPTGGVIRGRGAVTEQWGARDDIAAIDPSD